MGLPFDLRDLLQRVIPGSLFLMAIGIAFGLFGQSTLQLPKGMGIPLFFSAAYAAGVGLNTLGGMIGPRLVDRYWSPTSPRRDIIGAAICDHFGIEAGEDSWRLCYGTCIKEGYGVNTELFAGLLVFCRSMFAGSAIAGLAFLIAAALQWTRGFTDPLLISSVAICFVAASIFYVGAGRYAEAFVGSIYDSFFNWYCDHRKQSAETNIVITEAV